MSAPENPQNSPTTPRRRRPPFWVLLILLAMVLVPFFFWHGTWFGRALTDDQLDDYLAQPDKPRKTQHALVQIGERIVAGDPSVKRWYPRVQEMARHERSEVRSTAAWVMGQDNQSQEFHAVLVELLADSHPLVRRNAALSLVRFADARARPELRYMLLPYAVTAPAQGTVTPRLKVGDSVNPHTLLARIRSPQEEEIELRAPLAGRLQRWLVGEGEGVEVGDAVVLLSPAPDQVWEALRALYLIGKSEDLTEIEPFTRGVEGMPEKVRRQAVLTTEAIRRRAEQNNQEMGEDPA